MDRIDIVAGLSAISRADAGYHFVQFVLFGLVIGLWP